MSTSNTACRCYVCRHQRWLFTGKGVEPELSDTPNTELDRVCDDLVFKHERKDPAITDWCCLREESVREAIQAYCDRLCVEARKDELAKFHTRALQYDFDTSTASDWFDYIDDRIASLSAKNGETK